MCLLRTRRDARPCAVAQSIMDPSPACSLSLRNSLNELHKSHVNEPLTVGGFVPLNCAGGFANIIGVSLMSKEDIKKTFSELPELVEKLERQNQPAQPSNEQARMDTAQEVHEAALTSFQTKRLGKKNISLNSASGTEAQIQ